MESRIRTKEDIFQLIRQNEEKIRSLGVRRIGLFGSFIRGEQRPDSDVDLLVDFEPRRKTFDHFMELSFFLEEALLRRVELVTPESLSPHLKPHILSEVEYASLTA
jgi:predicted nucleotidyltransferase